MKKNNHDFNEYNKINNTEFNDLSQEFGLNDDNNEFENYKVDNVKEFSEENEFSDSEEYNEEVNKETITNTSTKTSFTDNITNIVKTLSLVGVSTTAIVGLSLIASIVGVGTTKTYDVDILDLTTTENSIFYAIDANDNDNLNLSIKGDNLDYSISLNKEENYDTIYNLKSNTEYTLIINDSDGNNVKEEVLTTKEEKEISEIKDITIDYKCKCNIDGYFHFTINYVDDLNKYTNFKASLTDDFDNTNECVFSSNYHDEQVIDLSYLMASESGVRFIVTVVYENTTYTLIDTYVII